MNLPKRLIPIFIAAFLSWTFLTFAIENVPRFRGINGQGVYGIQRLPANLSIDNLLWKVELPGSGHSSPVIYDNQIFLTSANSDKKQGFLCSYDLADGKLIWKKQISLDDMKMHIENSYATSTPTVDDNFVYTVWASSEKVSLTAYSHSGEIKWQKDFDGIITRHGYGASPIIVNDLIVFSREQEILANNPFSSTWIAVDRKTGNVRWQIEREKTDRNSFSTPCIYSDNNKEYLIFTCEFGFVGVDPVDGNVLWEIKTFDARTVSSPVVSDDMIFASCKSKLVALRIDQSGAPQIVYELPNKYTPYCPTPLYKNDLLINFSDIGYISCHNAQNGDLIWREKPAGKYFSSPIYVDGKIYGLSEDGDLIYFEADANFKLLGKIEFEELTHATPVVAFNKLIVRTLSHLFCLGDS